MVTREDVRELYVIARRVAPSDKARDLLYERIAQYDRHVQPEDLKFRAILGWLTRGLTLNKWE